MSIRMMHCVKCGNGRITNIKPMRHVRRTSLGRTFQQIPSALVARDLDLPAREYPIANYTGALIVKRVPLPLAIARTQNFQPLFQSEMFLHNYFRIEKGNQIARLKPIGPRP
jgi:hypothetical protein